MTKPQLDLKLTVTNDTDQSLTYLINGQAYEYFFNGTNFKYVKTTTRKLYDKSPGRCLAWVKRNCVSWEKIDG